MAGRLVWAIYTTDSGVEYVKLAAEYQVADPNRGWTPLLVDPLNYRLMPRRSTPRYVYGISKDTGRRGYTIVGNIAAELWNPDSAVKTFVVKSGFTVSGEDVMTITSRSGESMPAPYAPA